MEIEPEDRGELVVALFPPPGQAPGDERTHATGRRNSHRAHRLRSTDLEGTRWVTNIRTPAAFGTGPFGTGQSDSVPFALNPVMELNPVMNRSQEWQGTGFSSNRTQFLL